MATDKYGGKPVQTLTVVSTMLPSFGPHLSVYPQAVMCVGMLAAPITAAVFGFHGLSVPT